MVRNLTSIILNGVYLLVGLTSPHPHPTVESAFYCCCLSLPVEMPFATLSGSDTLCQAALSDR